MGDPVWGRVVLSHPCAAPHCRPPDLETAAIRRHRYRASGFHARVRAHGARIVARTMRPHGPATRNRSMKHSYAGHGPRFQWAIGLLALLAALPILRSEEHTSELQSLMRISYAVFCLKKNKNKVNINNYE